MGFGWGAEVGGPIFEPCKTAGEGAAVSHVLVLEVSFCCQGKALGVHSIPEFVLHCIICWDASVGACKAVATSKSIVCPGPIESPARMMLQEGVSQLQNPFLRL